MQRTVIVEGVLLSGDDVARMVRVLRLMVARHEAARDAALITLGYCHLPMAAENAAQQEIDTDG